MLSSWRVKVTVHNNKKFLCCAESGTISVSDICCVVSTGYTAVVSTSCTSYTAAVSTGYTAVVSTGCTSYRDVVSTEIPFTTIGKGFFGVRMKVCTITKV